MFFLIEEKDWWLFIWFKASLIIHLWRFYLYHLSYKIRQSWSLILLSLNIQTTFFSWSSNIVSELWNLEYHFKISFTFSFLLFFSFQKSFLLIYCLLLLLLLPLISLTLFLLRRRCTSGAYHFFFITLIASWTCCVSNVGMVIGPFCQIK